MSKVKLLELKVAEPVLNKLISQPVLGKPAFKVASIIKIVGDQLVLLRDQERKLFEKFGEVKEDAIQVKSENMIEFQKEMLSLLNTEIELSIIKVSPDDIDKFTITPEDALNILWITE